MNRHIAVAGHNLKLEPAAARHLHLRHESQPSRRLQDLHLPAVERVALPQPLRIAAASRHPRPAQHAVDPAADDPEPVAGIPAIRTADPLDRCEGLVSRHRHHRVTMIDEHAALVRAAVPPRRPTRKLGPITVGEGGVFAAECLAHGRAQVARHERKLAVGGVVGHDSRVLEAVDQLLPYLRVSRRHEFEPQPGEPRRQHRHRDHQPAEASLPGVLVHDGAIRDLVWTANLKDSRTVGRQVSGCGEIGHNIGDRDRLGWGGQPCRADHHRESLDEHPHEVKRKAARPDDDRGPKLDHVEAARPQDRPHLLATAEVWREPVVIGSETTEVDDLSHAGRGGGGRKPLRREPVGPLEVDAALHRVDEPVGDLDARAGPGQVGRVGGIALNDLCRGARAAGEPLRTPHQAADRMTAAL